jgi:hypothetical protein
MNVNRLRYKIFTSFALSVLGLITIVRLWGVDPPSAQTWLPYLTAVVLVAAAFWRGIIFVRAANHRAD